MSTKTQEQPPRRHEEARDAWRAPGIPLGVPARTRREVWRRRVLWVGGWLVFLSSPVHDLVSGRHGTEGTVAGWLGLAVFVVAYLSLLFRDMGATPYPSKLVGALIGCMAVLASALCLTLGSAWLGLYCYVSVACGISLQMRLAFWTVPGTGALMLLVGLRAGEKQALDLLFLVLLIGFAMTGVGQLVRTTVELRQARATVAQFAANEERLRLARDLHDLLGHSLSLITLKSELAGRMLPEQPEQAARQVADIERVSRQALVDVREAVTGYRRPRLAAELAGAQVALTAAGIRADLPAGLGPDHLGEVLEDSESALAWALREAVTNVVRHSGATRCTVEVARRQTLEGPVLELRVEDDGGGGSGRVPGGPGGSGNGLAGLAERLEKAGGTLEAGRVKHGFRLVARVPAALRPAVGTVGSGS